MAAITLTATGSNSLSVASLAAGAHRDFHVYNPSEHTIIINALGAITTLTNGVPNNLSVAWTNADDNNTPATGTRNYRRALVIEPNTFRTVSLFNNHTAAQAINLTAESAHGAGDYVGDVVYIGTLNTVNTAGVN